jgi:hypothetical protein
MGWARNVERMRQRLDIYRNSVGKLKRKKPLGKPRRRGRCNIKMDLQVTGWKTAWSGLSWLRIITRCWFL